MPYRGGQIDTGLAPDIVPPLHRSIQGKEKQKKKGGAGVGWGRVGVGWGRVWLAGGPRCHCVAAPGCQTD